MPNNYMYSAIKLAGLPNTVLERTVRVAAAPYRSIYMYKPPLPKELSAPGVSSVCVKYLWSVEFLWSMDTTRHFRFVRVCSNP